MSGPDGRTVLIVEDEALVLDIAKEEFAESGWRVLVATDTAQALALINSEEPIDLLFTDIRLPGAGDGWVLAERARERRPEVAVIYATGFSSEEPRMVAGSLLLRKPYRVAAVIEAAQRLDG